MQGGVPGFARELTKPLAKSLLIVNVDVLSTEEDDASLGNYTLIRTLLPELGYERVTH